VRAFGGACCSTASGGARCLAAIRRSACNFVKVDGAITRKIAVAEAARNKMEAIRRVGESLAGFGGSPSASKSRRS
jgi:hypothetical protein